MNQPPHPKIEPLAPHPDLIALLHRVIQLNSEVVDQNRRIINIFEAPQQLVAHREIDPDFLERLTKLKP